MTLRPLLAVESRPSWHTVGDTRNLFEQVVNGCDGAAGMFRQLSERICTLQLYMPACTNAEPDAAAMTANNTGLFNNGLGLALLPPAKDARVSEFIRN